MTRPAVGPPTLTRRQLFALDAGEKRPCLDYWIRVYRRAMACRFEVILSGEDARHLSAAQAVLDEVDRIEEALSVFRPTSELSRVNREAAGAPVTLDDDLFDLLCRCRGLHVSTGGAFDITSTPLSRCWGFLKRAGRMPSLDEIASARTVVGMDGVVLDAARRTVRFLAPGIELNLGSIGKGYALQRVAALLTRHGVRHALLSAGSSSILALGGRDGGWTIDLCSPQVNKPRLAQVKLKSGALGTSGAGEQFVEIDGRRYGHVLDPRTGWPASGVLSASVMTRDGADADALATAFLVNGPALAERYCSSHPDVLVLLTPDDGSERVVKFGAYAGATLTDY